MEDDEGADEDEDEEDEYAEDVGGKKGVHSLTPPNFGPLLMCKDCRFI